MGGDSRSEGHWFKSQRRILDGHDIFHIDLLWELYCLLEKTEINEKEARVGPFQKNFYQNFRRVDPLEQLDHHGAKGEEEAGDGRQKNSQKLFLSSTNLLQLVLVVGIRINRFCRIRFNRIRWIKIWNFKLLNLTSAGLNIFGCFLNPSNAPLVFK